MTVYACFKRGVKTNDLYLHPLQQEPLVFTKVFGYDTIGRGLEVGYIFNDEGEEYVIHAMKIRPSYKAFLSE
jgi:hypothetical protein